MARSYEQRGPSAATTQSQAAAALDVSKRQIRRAKALERKLPELAGQVASGAMTLHAALKQVERQNGEGRPIGLPSNNEDTQCDKYESIDHQSTWAAALLSFARLLNFLSKRESSASSGSGAIAYGAAYGFQLLQLVNPAPGSR